MKSVVLSFIKIYRLCISPLLGPTCRYQPSCSEYMSDAIRIHGLVKGVWLGCRRFFSCHPCSKRPLYDPVPDKSLPKADR